MAIDATCRVYWAAPLSPDDSPALVALLDDHERERLARFRRPADSARYLAAHAMTRIVLGEQLGVAAGALEFDRLCRCGQQHGKPNLPAPGAPSFSFSHAGDLVGLAVHSGPVGIDVEEVREMSDLAGMRTHVCSPTELAAGAGATSASFFDLWTCKEAVLKTTGDGLSVPMPSVTLGPSGVEEWAGDDAPGRPIWVHRMQPAPGYPAAVAGFGETAPEVTEHDGNPLLH